jgi:sec-independent protein translocase protein TatA
MLSGIKLPELLIIAAIVLLLFGAKRLPEAARGLGRSLRIFKAETKGLTEDTTTATTVAGDAPAAPPVQPPAAPEGDRTQA